MYRVAPFLFIQACFNPLPLPKQGEMSGSTALTERQVCFNPLPLPKQGEMGRSVMSRSAVQSFNPLPLPKQGEISPLRALALPP